MVVQRVHDTINIEKIDRIVNVAKDKAFVSVEKPKHVEVNASAARSGVNGTTFIPHVDGNGILSWSNTGDMPNPSNVNLLVTGSVISNAEILGIVQG